MNKISILFFLAIFFVGKAQAQIVTDRPDQTESSSTVGKGNLQIESGFLIGYTGESIKPTRQILLPTTLFRYGITKGIELRLLNQIESVKFGDESTQGISDIEVGTKIQFFKKEESNTEVAFLSHLSLPSGTKALSAGEYGTINKLSISHGLGENLGLGYNIGYNYFGNINKKGDLTYSLALGIGVSEKVGIYIEPYGEVSEMENFVANFDAGFTYLMNDNLQFDFSFGTGITDRMNYVSIGASWLILSNKG